MWEYFPSRQYCYCAWWKGRTALKCWSGPDANALIWSSKIITNQCRVGVWFYFLRSTCTSGVNPSCILKSCSFSSWRCHGKAEGCAGLHWAGTAYWYKQTWDLLKEMPAWQEHHLEFRWVVHLCLIDNVITFITFLAESTCAQTEMSAQGKHFDWGDINSSH